jgi:deoxyribodipyrimidine photo-lyase
VLQSHKFDAKGDYIARWVPELRALDARGRHEPWTANDAAADYPAPIVDLKRSRQAALDAYQHMRD